MGRFIAVVSAGVLVLLPAPCVAAEAGPDAPVSMSPSNPQPPLNKNVSFGFSAGPELRELYDIPVRGFDLRGMFGPAHAWLRYVRPSAFASVMLGRTEAGLGVGHVVFGGRLEAVSPYFYGGVTFATGYFWVSRASGGSMGNLDGLCDVFAGPQLPIGEHVALTLEARFTVEELPGTDDTVAFGPGAAVGLRFY